jgi:glutaredoxin 3
MNGVVMYTTGICPFCIMAKRVFDDLGVSYEEIRVDQAPEQREHMIEISGRRTVPQVFIGERHVGGCDETQQALQSGHLQTWLKEAGIHV